MSDYQDEIEKMRLYVQRLGKPIETPTRPKRTFTPYADRIKKMNIVFNTSNSDEHYLLCNLQDEENVSAVIKDLLKDYYNI